MASETTHRRDYASWGRYPPSAPAHVERLRWRHALPPLDGGRPVLAYGRGRSYGDACLNNGGVLLDTAGLDRVLGFDREAGRLRAEAGMTLGEVLALVVPHGWFLPVTPGTRHVTLGGAVANDVHGKNHHLAGTFGRHVTRLGLARSTGERLTLEPGDPLFRATVAGLGLTGLILWVELRLQPVASDQVDVATTRFEDLDAFFALSERANRRSPYVVAWVDAQRPEGRGVLIEGAHVGPDAGLPPPGVWRQRRLRVPFDAPEGLLRPTTLRLFNALYYRKQIAPVRRTRTHYAPFFYPLDAVRDWNRLYGRRGLLQHQCVVPFDDGREATRALLARVAESGAGSFLAVLKLFGDVPSPGLLSFPRPGVTLALDFAHRGEETVRLLHRLDGLVREAGGAVYPAKDACMTPESFRAFFPQWPAFAEHLDPAFSSSFWRRVTGG